jgi:hypothetical protein
LTRDEQPLAWLAILILASLRSPFLPGYAIIPVLWLLSLLAAVVAPRFGTVRTLCFALVAWLILNISVPQSGPDPRLISAILLLPQAVIVLLIVLALRNRPEPASASH